MTRTRNLSDLLDANGDVKTASLDNASAAVEATSNSNTFTDADHTKLNAIEASADVTDATNVAAAGALMTSGGTVTGNINFGDNDEAIFGAGTDLRIYYNASNGNSHITESGSGSLVINGDNLYLQNTAGTENYIAAISNDAVTLYHDNSAKIYTQSHGARIDGGLRFASSGAASDTANPYIFRASGVDSMVFATGSAERMRLTSAGSLGLGVTAPDGKLNVVSTAHNNGSIFDSTGTTQLWLRDTNATSNQRNWGFQVSGGDLNIVRANDDRASGFVTPVYIQQAPANSLVINSSGNATFNGTVFAPNVTLYPNSSAPTADAAIYRPQDGTLGFVSNGSERARFDSSGRFAVGKVPDSNFNIGCELDPAGFLIASRADNIAAYFNRNNDGGLVWFGRSSTNVGTISVTSSATTYSTSSDIRLKQDIEPLQATDKLMQMNPVSYNWKADPDGPRSMGFIAQEMQEVMPEAVNTGDDDDAMMAMDYGRITPILVSALQDAHRKIEQLESRLAALDA